MTQTHETMLIPDAERAADSRADALAAVVLVAIAVVTAIFWISGH